MSDERTIEVVERQLALAELESAAQQKSQGGTHHTIAAAKLVEALRAEIAAKRSE